MAEFIAFLKDLLAKNGSLQDVKVELYTSAGRWYVEISIQRQFPMIPRRMRLFSAEIK